MSEIKTGVVVDKQWLLMTMAAKTYNPDYVYGEFSRENPEQHWVPLSHHEEQKEKAVEDFKADLIKQIQKKNESNELYLADSAFNWLLSMLKEHQWQPTDTEGHCLQCTVCGTETSTEREDYDKVLNEECRGKK